jgi:hypothetical protein
MGGNESPPYIKSDGNGGYNISKGLAWVIGLGLPVLAAFAGAGISQMTSLATIQEQVRVNAQHIRDLQEWGPESGDRYSASMAREDWKRMFEKISELNARVSVLENKNSD